MSKENNGGAAFARPFSKTGEYADSAKEHAQTGMTLRDYFAAKAMASLIVVGANKIGSQEGVNGMVAASFLIADAMLAERAK